MRSTGYHAFAALAAACAIALAVARPASAAEPEWNIARINAPASAAGVVVAVVDTGVDAEHPALAGRVEPTIDLVGGPPGDPNGHGTHVAGTVAGADAGCGAIGVAPDARILPVRVLRADGTGYLDVVAEGIRRAADAGAAVINLSLGEDILLRHVTDSSEFYDAIDYAWHRGAIPVLAAGNERGLAGSPPDDLHAVVATATDHRDRIALYAAPVGSMRWGVAAPGGDASGQAGRDILSAYPGRRCARDAGTSMAAPHASGALAALRAAGHGRTAAVERLLATARDLGRPGHDGVYGHGLIDVGAALDTGASTPTTAAPPTTTTETTSPTTTTATTAGRPATDPETEPTAEVAPADRTTTTTPAVRPGDEDAASPSSAVSAQVERSRAGADASAHERAVEEPGSTDAQEGGGVPVGLVVAAVAGVGLAGAASGVTYRRLTRR